MNAPSKFALLFASLALVVPQSLDAKGLSAKLWNGTWHLDAEKSKFESPQKQVSETRSYTVSGNRVTMRSSSRTASGSMTFSYTAALDGKWYPMKGNPNANRISLTPVSDRKFKARSQLNGKPSVESTATVSADGKKLTITRKMLRFKGAPTDVLEFHR